jgi:hypothetical protein
MKAWILWDGRAEAGDTDDACVLEFAGHTRREVKECLYHWRGHDGVLAEYIAYPDGAALTNERIIGHLREGKALLDRCDFESVPT